MALVITAKKASVGSDLESLYATVKSMMLQIESTIKNYDTISTNYSEDADFSADEKHEITTERDKAYTLVWDEAKRIVPGGLQK
jgi:hypothetical protein